MKNNFKKQDSQGNKLPEEIGKGVNKEHVEKVLSQREIKDNVICVKLESSLHDKLIRKAGKLNVSKSFIIQELIKELCE